jgi:DNA-3-methyladenine glycosylase I
MPKHIYIAPDTHTRCGWCQGDEVYIQYHDTEWGRPVHDDQLLFEFLILEGFQAGLSWITILRKRDDFRRAFDGFDAMLISQYSAARVDALMQDTGIVRNRLKIAAAITNARAYLAVRAEFGTFDKYIWSFTGGETLVNHPKNLSDLPANTAISDAMSKDLTQRGFKFCGSTICYAYMQAIGMVDDHLAGCWLKGRVSTL